MQFFVDVDRDTLRRIVVEPDDERTFTVKTSLQTDHGLENPVTVSSVEGKPALEKLLLREGVARDAILSALGIEGGKPSRKWRFSGTSFAASLLVGSAVMLIHGCS